MHDYSIIKDIVLILLISIPIIAIFNRIQLPSIVGFLIAGIILGPSALKIISNPDQIEIMAEIGVILLMFSIGLEGKVIIEAVIDENGNVIDAKVFKRLGGGLDEESLHAVQTTRFSPGLQRGKPIRVRINIPVKFVLK